LKRDGQAGPEIVCIREDLGGYPKDAHFFPRNRSSRGSKSLGCGCFQKGAFKDEMGIPGLYFHACAACDRKAGNMKCLRNKKQAKYRIIDGEGFREVAL